MQDIPVRNNTLPEMEILQHKVLETVGMGN